MFDRVLKKFQKKVRLQEYIVTLHAEEEMGNDGLSIYDVESVILTGHIRLRQKDKGTHEWKYCVRGVTIERDSVEVIAKIGPTDKMNIITVYRL